MGVLLLLVVGLFVFRTELILAHMNPPEEFAVESVPAEPDYASLENWAAHPELEDTGDLRAPSQEDLSMPQTVDVFYIHPTTYFGPGEWNSLTRPDEAAAQNLQPALAGQASVFSRCCRIYAPHYRQAHLAAFSKTHSQASLDALDLAYQDVERAFEYFIDHFNDGRPFIIAGHSQGSLHAIRLLEARVQGTTLQDRMVVAYPIGYWIPEDKLTRGLGQIGLCENADQLGCFVAYDTYGDGGDGRDLSGTLPYWYNTGWEWVQTEKTLCVNPLTWDTDTERVGRDKHLGGMPLEPVFSLTHQLLNQHAGRTYESLPEPVANLTWAECHPDGTLFIESQTDNAFSLGINEQQAYHFYDWSLFYMNLKQNVENRISQYLLLKKTG
jgi:hypothetical protein